MNINEIVTTDWQMSATGFGDIAQGAGDINQCLNILLATQKGSDPLRPDFGIDLLNWIDKPTTVMAPGLVKEIIDQVALYETRIDLTDVNYSIPSEKVVFTLMWRYKDGSLYRGADELGANNTVYFLLSDQDGFVLLSDNDVSIIVN